MLKCSGGFMSPIGKEIKNRCGLVEPTSWGAMELVKFRGSGKILLTIFPNKLNFDLN